MNYVVVHGGQAHVDDFLCACILQSIYPGVPIFRKNEVSAEELADPEVWVCDIGGHYEPELHNFDHHQDDRDAPPECAFSRLVKYLFPDVQFNHLDWFDNLKLTDSKGRFAVAKANGWEKYPFQLLSPVECALLKIFEEVNLITYGVYFAHMMEKIGKQIVDSAKQVTADIKRLVNCERVSIEKNGVKVIVIIDEHQHTPGAQKFRDMMMDVGVEIAVSICHDNRDGGWVLYRFNDHPAVDFSVLSGREEILFVHKGGFVAKTKERLEISKVLSLVADALKK